MKIELHIHTKYSKDSMQLLLPLYIKCRIKGISIVAITDHNNIYGGIKLEKICKKFGNKIHVIVGEEIFTDSGEIIGLFLKDNIKPGMSVDATISEIKRQGGLVYSPHPYDEKRKKTVLKEHFISLFRDEIDCIEVYNGRNVLDEYAVKQREIADKYSLKYVIGSDAHTTLEVGRNYIHLDDKYSCNSKDDFIACIDYFDFHKSKCLRMSHKITVLVKLIKMIWSGKYNELYRTYLRKFKRNKL